MKHLVVYELTVHTEKYLSLRPVKRAAPLKLAKESYHLGVEALLVSPPDKKGGPIEAVCPRCFLRLGRTILSAR